MSLLRSANFVSYKIIQCFFSIFSVYNKPVLVDSRYYLQYKHIIHGKRKVIVSGVAHRKPDVRRWLMFITMVWIRSVVADRVYRAEAYLRFWTPPIGCRINCCPPPFFTQIRENGCLLQLNMQKIVLNSIEFKKIDMPLKIRFPDFIFKVITLAIITQRAILHNFWRYVYF